jgi:mannose-6-phosphate isomerase-like protein (cupin superfamily)
MFDRLPGESVDTLIGTAHRCENKGDVPVVLIEVQTGTYFGEDDVVCLEDDFGRSS